LVPFGSKTKTGHTGIRSKNTLNTPPDFSRLILSIALTALLRRVHERSHVRAAIYARVSTTDQKCEMQWRNYVNMYRAGWERAGEYVDTGWSGTSIHRPEFNQLMHDAGQRKFDVILCWKLDRFGRSLHHCKNALPELQTHGIRFIATSQNIDTDESNPAARFLLHVIMAAAEFERELIRERSILGQKRYRMQYEAGKGGEGSSQQVGKRSARWTTQEDFCPAGSMGAAGARSQLSADCKADGDWRRDCEASVVTSNPANGGHPKTGQ
jgi:DNA invertase Pin-like site-specific DNA recombinase